MIKGFFIAGDSFADSFLLRTRIIYADTLTLILEGIARVIEVHQPLIETYYGSEKLIDLLEVIQVFVKLDCGFSTFTSNYNLGRIWSTNTEGNKCIHSEETIRNEITSSRAICSECFVDSEFYSNTKIGFNRIRSW